MTDNPQPEALRLADELEREKWHVPAVVLQTATEELCRQHTRIAELEAQLESIGASAGSEPVAWTGGEEWEQLAWHLCAEEHGEDACDEVLWEGGPVPEPWGARWLKYESDAKRMIELVRRFYAHPSPPEGMVGGLQVYRCKIKSRKQIDREIPRELQGWWADVAAGQKLLLRQAVQSDLDRCNLGGKRSRNPTDYMCETHTYGSLVSKTALEYMSPEENVFAAPPTTSAGSGKGE